MINELARQQEAQLNALVPAGRFESVEQFISYSLAAVTHEEDEHTDWLRAETLKGLASLDAGHYSAMTTEQIAAEGARQLDQRR
jgi:Arc/MetJ-type ribon-helix-helix transcriptional regulator